MISKRILWIVVSLGLLTLIVGNTHPVNSSSLVGGSFPISPVTPAEWPEWYPAVAYNSTWQEYLVVWQMGSTGGNTIYGQRLSGQGALLGPRSIIAVASGWNYHADIAYNPARDEYLLVYQVGAGGSAICGVRLNSIGAVIAGEQCFGNTSGYTYFTPAVAYETDSGYYMVTWEKDQGTAFAGIEARSLLGDGSVMGATLEITGMVANVHPNEPDIACVRTLDGCLIVWAQWYDATFTDRDIRGQRIHIDFSGAHREELTFGIHITPHDEFNPAIAAVAKTTGIGQYLVVCDYNQLTPSLIAVAGRLVTDTGALDTWLVAGKRLGVSFFPSVAGSDGAQHYLVAWKEDDSISAQIISTNGALVGDRTTVFIGLSSEYPAVVNGPLGDYLITWHARYATGYGQDVFGHLWGNRIYTPIVKK